MLIGVVMVKDIFLTVLDISRWMANNAHNNDTWHVYDTLALACDALLRQELFFPAPPALL
jgi:hypothetical protein